MGPSDPTSSWTGRRSGGREERWQAFASGPPQNSDIRLTLPARPENVAVVRHVLGALAEALDLPDGVCEDLKLAVTEACTNVVRHAYQGGEGPIELLVQGEGDTLRIMVSDRGQGIAPSIDKAGPGLGLPLIAALADELEIDHGPDRGSRLCMAFRRCERTERMAEAL